jgi:hypothetical protein
LKCCKNDSVVETNRSPVSAASIVQLFRPKVDELDLPMTSSCFPVAIGPVRRQDRWRAAKGDGDFRAKEEDLAYEST